MRYFTKEWFLKCQIQPQTDELRAELDSAAKSFRSAQSRENLPRFLRENFLFHDGKVLKTETDTDCVIEIDSPYSEYHKITFCNALIKQAFPPVGAVWLYEELYRHKSGTGYEANILSFKMQMPKHNQVLITDLFETRIICRDILLE